MQADERIESNTYDVILFNFPHIDGKPKIHLNRALVRGYLCSAAPLVFCVLVGVGVLVGVLMRWPPGRSR